MFFAKWAVELRRRVPRGAWQMEAAGRRHGVRMCRGLFLSCRFLAVPGALGWARRGLRMGVRGNHRGESLGLWGRVPPLFPLLALLA
jgi:hypothetical protein